MTEDMRSVVQRRRGERAEAEAAIINAMPPPAPLSARTAALSGTLMGSKIAGAFHPASWSEGQRILKGRIVG